MAMSMSMKEKTSNSHIDTEWALTSVSQFQFWRPEIVARFAESEGIPIARFGKRHLDAYLASRLDGGVSQMTLHHDALSAQVFLSAATFPDAVRGRSWARIVLTDSPLA